MPSPGRWLLGPSAPRCPGKELLLPRRGPGAGVQTLMARASSVRRALKLQGLQLRAGASAPGLSTAASLTSRLACAHPPMVLPAPHQLIPQATEPERGVAQLQVLRQAGTLPRRCQTNERHGPPPAPTSPPNK